MRHSLTALLLATVVPLAGCSGGTAESYPAPVSDTWSKVTGAAYSAAAFAVPVGLAGSEVRSVFESFPGERAGYWKFVRHGRELGRLNVIVDGDTAESSVAYSYERGDLSSQDEAVEKMVRQYAQPLIVEAIDAALENRARDEEMRRYADSQTATAMVGQMFDEVDTSLNAAVARFDEQERSRKRSKANKAVREAKTNATKPMVSLGGAN